MQVCHTRKLECCRANGDKADTVFTLYIWAAVAKYSIARYYWFWQILFKSLTPLQKGTWNLHEVIILDTT